MSDLILDTDELRTLYRDLLLTSITFEDFGSSVDAAADSVGNDELSERVRDFSRGWENRRKEIVASLDTLWKAAQSIASNFDELDQQMAGGLSSDQGGL